MKDVSEEKINDEFVGLKWKIHSMKNIDGEEFNMAKGINVALNLINLKTLYLIKKTQNERNSK